MTHKKHPVVEQFLRARLLVALVGQWGMSSDFRDGRNKGVYRCRSPSVFAYGEQTQDSSGRHIEGDHISLLISYMRQYPLVIPLGTRNPVYSHYSL